MDAENVHLNNIIVYEPRRYRIKKAEILCVHLTTYLMMYSSVNNILLKPWPNYLYTIIYIYIYIYI